MTLEMELWQSSRSLDCPDQGAAVWWLGQAGFLIEMGGLRIVIDAYLSDSLAEKYKGKRFTHIRMTDAPVAPSDMNDIDWVLCTHAHTDHMDPGTIPAILETNPQAKVIVPRSEVARAIERGVPQDRLVAVNDGERLCLGEVELYATPAAHETLERDEAGNSRYLGYALRGGGVTVWHSGDTIPFEGLVETVAPLFVDLALLPVNGRDELRAGNGVPGNLTLEEAVALSDRIGAGAMLGHHLDLFDFNTLDRRVGQDWLDRHAKTSCRALVELNQRYVIRPRLTRQPRKILAVCRGNICRSPIAQAVLEDLLKNRPEWKVDSAAIEDWNVGRAPDPRSIAVANAHGLDLKNQCARQITDDDFNECDLILAMDSENVSALEAMTPSNAKARILRLGDLLAPGQSHDIADPYDFSVAEFEECFRMISVCCRNLLKGI